MKLLFLNEEYIKIFNINIFYIGTIKWRKRKNLR